GHGNACAKNDPESEFCARFAMGSLFICLRASAPRSGGGGKETSQSVRRATNLSRRTVISWAKQGRWFCCHRFGAMNDDRNIERPCLSAIQYAVISLLPSHFYPQLPRIDRRAGTTLNFFNLFNLGFPDGGLRRKS